MRARRLPASAARLALALCALALWLAPAAAAEGDEAEPEPPRIYKWIDENGIAHYTTDRSRIPGGLRRRADELGSDGAPLERERYRARAPAAAFDAWVLRNRGAVGEDVWDEGPAAGAGGAVASVPASPEERAARRAEMSELDDRIARLEAEVAADEILLKAMISDADTPPIERGRDPEFRVIAERLPKTLSELQALRDRREQLGTP